MARSPEIRSTVFSRNIPSRAYARNQTDVSTPNGQDRANDNSLAMFAGDRTGGLTVPVGLPLRSLTPGGRSSRRIAPARCDSPHESWNRRPCGFLPRVGGSGQPVVFVPRPLSAPLSLSGAHPPPLGERLFSCVPC